MGSKAILVPKKKAKKGELDLGNERQVAVNTVTEKLYEQYCGMESTFQNSMGNSLFALEQKAAEEIAAIDPKDEKALNKMKEILDNFYDAVDKDFKFLVGEYNVKYSKKTLKDIQGSGEEGGDYKILDHEKIKQRMSTAASEGISAVLITAKTIDKKMKTGAADVKTTEPVKMGYGTPSSESFDRNLVSEVSEALSSPLKERGMSIKTKDITEFTSKKGIMLAALKDKTDFQT